jgi:hypothetical protein
MRVFCTGLFDIESNENLAVHDGRTHSVYELCSTIKQYRNHGRKFRSQPQKTMMNQPPGIPYEIGDTTNGSRDFQRETKGIQAFTKVGAQRFGKTVEHDESIRKRACISSARP